MRKLTLVSNGKPFPLEVAEDSGRIQVRVAGEPAGIEVGRHSSVGISLLMGSRSYEAQVLLDERQVAVELEGERFVFEIDEGALPGRTGRRHDSKGLVEVNAPMPGKVVKLLVSQGDRVQAGQGVLLFEAMKMQNEIRSPLPGSVVSLAVQEGQAVESREKLFSVKGTEGS